MTRKNFLSAVFFLTLLICSAALVGVPTLSFAADSLTFEGRLTLNVNNREISVNGGKAENISMPEPFKIETQDDHPSVLAMTLKDNGYISRKADINVKTSESFILKSDRISGLFVLRGRGDNAKLLLKTSSNKDSYEIPAVTEDYYIMLKDSPDENDDDEIIEAATLFYVKMSVTGPAKSDSRFPIFASCTGDSVRLRGAPGTDSKVIGKLDKFDYMTIFDSKTIKGETWYFVETEQSKITAWINGRYVKTE